MNASDVAAVARLLEADYARNPAPIVDLIKAQTEDPFHILVATLLSARTRDETTAEVCARLFAVVHAPGDLQRLSVTEIERLIFPTGFYHTKARHLKALPEVLQREFGGVIPQTIEALCRLPGVGRKTANLVVIHAFDQHGMCVDVHVHRISNRLGFIRTRTPLESEMALRAALPRRYWKRWNRLLVSHGQRICKPLRPLCARCPILKFCGRVGVKPR